MRAHQHPRINSRISQRNSFRTEHDCCASTAMSDKLSFAEDLKSKPAHCHIAQHGSSDVRHAPWLPNSTLMMLLLFARSL